MAGRSVRVGAIILIFGIRIRGRAFWFISLSYPRQDDFANKHGMNLIFAGPAANFELTFSRPAYGHWPRRTCKLGRFGFSLAEMWRALGLLLIIGSVLRTSVGFGAET